MRDCVVKPSFVILFVGVLAACSPPSPRSDTTLGSIDGAQRKTFSDAEVVAARKLSLAKDGAESHATPFAKAVQCQMALAATLEALREAGAINADQSKLLRQAENQFAGEAERLGQADGKTLAQVRKSLVQRPTNANGGEQARLALGCVRRGTNEN